MSASSPVSSAPPPLARVLIAAHLGAAERAQLAGHPALLVEDEAAALAVVVEAPFALVLVDLAMAADANEVWQRLASSSAPLLAYPRPRLDAIVDWLLQASREGPAQWQEAVDRLVEPGAKPLRRSSRLMREHTPDEAVELRRRALEASFEERARLMQGSLTTAQVAKLLGRSRQTPHDRVKAKTLLGLDDGGGLRFPPWQFDAGRPRGVVEGLAEVLQALEVGPMAQARWLTQPTSVFEGRTPLEALKAGEKTRVIVEARAVGASAGHG